MFKALTGTTKFLVIGAIVLIIILGIGLVLYFSGRAAGKRKATTNINLSDPLTGGKPPEASESEIKQLAGQLFEDMDGLNFFGHNEDTWNRFLSLNDTDIVRAYNEFNKQYQSESGQTLKQWVDSEPATVGDWSNLKTIIINRLNKLNLK